MQMKLNCLYQGTLRALQKLFRIKINSFWNDLNQSKLVNHAHLETKKNLKKNSFIWINKKIKTI